LADDPDGFFRRVKVPSGGFQIKMTEHFLYIPQGYAPFFQQGSQGMPGAVGDNLPAPQFDPGAFQPFEEMLFYP
jgi:hypothetical protein